MFCIYKKWKKEEKEQVLPAKSIYYFIFLWQSFQALPFPFSFFVKTSSSSISSSSNNSGSVISTFSHWPIGKTVNNQVLLIWLFNYHLLGQNRQNKRYHCSLKFWHYPIKYIRLYLRRRQVFLLLHLSFHCLKLGLTFPLLD